MERPIDDRPYGDLLKIQVSAHIIAGHSTASLSEGGGIRRSPARRMTEGVHLRTPSVTFGDSSLIEGACDMPFAAGNANRREMERPIDDRPYEDAFQLTKQSILLLFCHSEAKPKNLFLFFQKICSVLRVFIVL